MKDVFEKQVAWHIRRGQITFELAEDYLQTICRYHLTREEAIEVKADFTALLRDSLEGYLTKHPSQAQSGLQWLPSAGEAK